MHICCNNIKRFVNYLLLPTTVDWNASCHYPYQYQELYVPNNYDGVVVIMFFLYHIVYDCPIYFQQSHVVGTFRKKLAWWVLQKSLPI